jgi:hypothetical protein
VPKYLIIIYMTLIGTVGIKEDTMDESKAEALDRLKEIQSEMLELLDEADRILRHDFKGMIYERARSYWLAHVKMALTKDHGYLGGSMCDFEDTIKEIEEGDGEDSD